MTIPEYPEKGERYTLYMHVDRISSYLVMLLWYPYLYKRNEEKQLARQCPFRDYVGRLKGCASVFLKTSMLEDRSSREHARESLLTEHIHPS